MKNLTSILGLIFLNFSIAQSDGCTGVPSLPMGSGVCANTAFTLPGAFANGGLVNAGCAANTDADDGWFSFTTGPAQTSVNIEETSTPRRHLISVWTACGGGTELGCDQENSGVTASLNLTGLSPSTTYFIQIHRRSGSSTSGIAGDICVYEPVSAPPVPEDCSGGTEVCVDATFSGNSSGSGAVSDLNVSNEGCLNGENESSWYFFEAATDGTIAFMINTIVDYDFAVWGPLASISCPPSGSPIRCSFSGTAGNTGLQSGAGDLTEDNFGDAVVEPINALAGEKYILLIDNFTSDASNFSINWTLTNGASLECIILPIEIVNFKGEPFESSNYLSWETKSEINSKKMIIQRSENGKDFVQIGALKSSGNSSNSINYSFNDSNVQSSVNYYRIKMVNTDLSHRYSEVISVRREIKNIVIHPNPSDGEFTLIFPIQQTSRYTVVYRSLTGQTVKENVELNDFQNKFTSSALKEMDAGLYFVEITDVFGSLIQFKRIIKK